MIRQYHLKYILNSSDSSFELTSYQCALCIDDRIPVNGFNYIVGSSGLNSIIPSVGIDFNTSDTKTKVTFASLPGSDIISSNKIKVGKFLIKTSLSPDDSIPLVKWCFDDKISTILTGKDFEDITVAKNHKFENKGELNISNIIASSTYTGASTDYLTDGKLYDNGNNDAIWKTDVIPAYLIFDLGESQVVSQTKFSFYNWQNGRKYTYSLYISDDTSNWSEVVIDAISSSEEWTINNLSNERGRYLKLLVSNNSETSLNNWTSIWEAQIYGNILDSNNVSTAVNKKSCTPTRIYIKSKLSQSI